MEEPVGIVSNNFHLYRACLLAESFGYRKACPMAAGCHPVLLINYMVREVFCSVEGVDQKEVLTKKNPVFIMVAYMRKR